MKELRSKAMKKLLKQGKNLAKKNGKLPSEGSMINLIYKTLKNGWHYQVEHIYDLRVDKRKYVVVYAFKPGARLGVADYYLREFI